MLELIYESSPDAGLSCELIYGSLVGGGSVAALFEVMFRDVMLAVERRLLDRCPGEGVSSGVRSLGATDRGALLSAEEALRVWVVGWSPLCARLACLALLDFNNACRRGAGVAASNISDGMAENESSYTSPP